MGKIQIIFGIYDISILEPFHFEGYNHKETRNIVVMCNKLQKYLKKKADKFLIKYGYKEFVFVFARDAEHHIETVAIVHPKHDKFNPLVGEDIVIGRIKRMRGDIREPYDLKEHIYTKMRNGEYHDDGLKYPYIHKLTKEDNEDQPMANMMVDNYMESG